MSASVESQNINPDDPVYGSFLNETGITPLGYKLLLKPCISRDIQRAKDSGIEIPETAMDRHQAAAVTALVIQVGAGAYSPERYPNGAWVRPGDFVAMSPYTGTRVRSRSGDEYRLVNEDSIDAVVPGPEYVERG